MQPAPHTLQSPSQPEAVLEQSLHQTGRRMTAQRALILSALEPADRHLDAEGIYEIARRDHPNLNLATVYRTLAVLKEMGLVEQRYFARDHKREYYEAVGKREHYHFTCMACGKVIEVETPRIRQARQELSAALGLTFTHACVCFEGYCVACAASGVAEDEEQHEHAG